MLTGRQRRLLRRRVIVLVRLQLPDSTVERKFMTDPRNIAHDKKVQQEKKKHGEEIAPDAVHAPQPGQKPRMQQPVKEQRDEDSDAGTQTRPDTGTSDI
jgi:hypothetical protein